MRRMLVTTDGSPASEAVIPVAADLARSLGAEVHLLRVVAIPHAAGVTHRHNPDPTSLRSSFFYEGTAPASTTEVAESRDQAIERVVAEARDQLELLAKSFSPSVPVRRRVQLHGDVAEAIIAVAKELQADLIAMSTHGRGGAATVVQGSVASRVIRAGVAPVLLSRPEALRS